ncbi:MAG: hypothetical protein C4K58_03245 [Flavobacteriaceae bacterium]|nr:MAG: hypothetical protein C4K58_03245 [Flavobacteriaceae bacterium]
MKTISKFFFLFVFTLFGLISCEDDNPPTSKTDYSSSIVGKWEFLKTGEKVNNQILWDDNIDLECGKDYIEFSQDKSYKDINFYSGENGICEDDVIGGIWTIKDKLITVDITDVGDEYSFGVEILEITDSKLVVNVENEEYYWMVRKN